MRRLQQVRPSLAKHCLLRSADVNGSLTVMPNGEHTIRPTTYKKYITKY